MAVKHDKSIWGKKMVRDEENNLSYRHVGCLWFCMLSNYIIKPPGTQSIVKCIGYDKRIANQLTDQLPHWMQQSPSWESNSTRASQKIPKLNGTSKINTMSKRAHTFPCSESDPMQSMPCYSLPLNSQFHTLPSMHRSSKLSICSRISNQNTLHISSPPYMSHTQLSLSSLCINGMLCCTHGLQRDTQSAHTILVNYLLQCTPNPYVCKPLSGSENNQGSSNSCSHKYGVRMIGIQN
jgi:hypothetical protein